MARVVHTREEKRKLFKKLAIVVACVAVFCAAIAIVFKVVDVQKTKQEQLEAELGVITINGVKYVPKGNIETYLFMGIDNMDTVSIRTDYDENAGQCDTLVLLVRDLSTGTYKTLPLNRNTITAVDSLTVSGEYLLTSDIQLSLAHSKGDGGEMSCENVVKAVSNLLMGQEITGYAAVNMGAISIINHLIGGVTVTIEDDFSDVDDTMIIGETITLTDEQAVHYIHDRKEVSDGTNANRMNRQSIYMAGAKAKIIALCGTDASFPLDLYESLQDYMVTNISSSKFCKLALLMAQDKDEGELTIEGETVIDDMNWEAFYPDEDSLLEVIIELFYDVYE